MINEYLFRLAFVVNTSHTKFYDNLASIIVYIIYENQDVSVSVRNITLSIQDKLGLEFTEKEVLASVTKNQGLFTIQSDMRVALSDNGARKINDKDCSEMNKVIRCFIAEYNLNMKSEEISELIYKFLYGCLNQNIELLLNVVQGIKGKFPTMDYLSNEQRKIINDFLDWDYEPKNKLLVQLISFSVDYCRLSVKKDTGNFLTLLNGKRFYLDANIFFRMMGVNNEERQESTLHFIEKCKSVKIKLCYTTITRQEVIESITYHVNEVRKTLQGYRGKGDAVENLFKKTGYQDGFVTLYLEWCKETNTRGDYAEYEQYLKKRFFECVQGFKLEEVKNIRISNEEIDDYIAHKDGRIRRENAIYDLQNVRYIERKRSNVTSIGWNINEYLISADHKLIDWSMDRVSSVNPLVVLPSVWYSIILKVSGRSLDEERSFVEFIKLRYIQDRPEHNIRNLISVVCRKTTCGEIQDMLFEEISSNNTELNQISFSKDEDDIGVVVDQKYENILETTQKNGYETGKKEGTEAGFQSGRVNGFESGKKTGERIGKLKTERDNLKNQACKSAISKRRRHIVYSIIVCIGSLVFFYWFFNNVENEKIVELYNQAQMVSCLFPAVCLTGLSAFFFSLDLEKIKKEEEIKIEPNIRELDSEIKSLETTGADFE